MKISFSWLVALLCGLAVLVGYFIPAFQNLRTVVLEIAVYLGAFALLAGVWNLLSVHWHKVETEQKGSGYSIVLILAFLVPFVMVGLDIFTSDKKPFGYWTLWVFNNIQLPVESSLFALLAVVLVYAAARLLRRRINAASLIFFVTVVIVLLMSSPYVLREVPILHQVRNLLNQSLVIGGARGVLLGVALGTIATAIRILMGADRPYG